MPVSKRGCLVCGEELVYGQTEKLECFYRRRVYDSNAECKDAHFVCDKCHSMPGNELIEKLCALSKL